MWGGYVWASVWLGAFVVGLAMVVIALRYTRTHKRRPPVEKEMSDAVTRENYRHPVK